MMDIRIAKDGAALAAALTGSLDTMTAPKLEDALKDLSGVEALTLDFAGLTYISSAGLRVLLALQKKMTSVNGTMVVRNVCDAIKEVFEMTGFDAILTVE